MSGPKGYEYQVRAAERERQRAVENAIAQCREIYAALAADLTDARALGIQLTAAKLPRIASAATAERATAALNGYRAECDRVRAELAIRHSESIARTFAAHMPARLEARVEVAWRASAPLEVRADEAVGTDDTKIRDDVATRVIGALVAVADENRRDAWLARAATAAHSTGRDAVRALRAIEQEVQTSLREQDRLDRLRAEARDVSLALAEVRGPDADSARAALARVATREELRDAVALAGRARAGHEASRDRAYVIAQTAEALAELGYEVDDEFVVAAASGGFAVAAKHGIHDHALQVRFDPARGRMLTNTVALRDGTSIAADIAAEQKTCADLDGVVARMQADGVYLHRYHDRAPGELPVERRLDAAKHARRGRPRAKQSDAAIEDENSR